MDSTELDLASGAPTRTVAFLRGINVTGRRARSQDLVEAFAGLGLADVQTFLASGNVLYRPEPGITDEYISGALGAKLGFDVEVTTRTANELNALVAEQPFPPEAVDASTAGPQVMFLFHPITDAVRQAVATVIGEDRFVFGKRELHWLPAAGVADSDRRQVQKAVGSNTIRTVRTVVRLVSKL